MPQIQPIKDISPSKGFAYYFKIFLYKTSALVELVLIFFVWWFIFHNNFDFKGFSRQELMTYLIVANLIGMISSHFLEKVVILGMTAETSKTLIYSPILFFKRLFLKTFGLNFIPFLGMILLQTALFYYFNHYFIVNFDSKYLFLIFVMLFLSFIVEVLFAYLLRILIFWFFEIRERYNIIVRLKKILAGNYFPLSILPSIFMQISLILPFSYAFFVPYELYLKKISIIQAGQGLLVQIFWIFIFYFLIRLINSRQIRGS